MWSQSVEVLNPYEALANAPDKSRNEDKKKD